MRVESNHHAAATPLRGAELTTCSTHGSGGWRDSNPAWTGITTRCFDPSASSSVDQAGLEPARPGVWNRSSAAELLIVGYPEQDSNLQPSGS